MKPSLSGTLVQNHRAKQALRYLQACMHTYVHKILHLIIYDVIIKLQLKRLAYGFGLMLSILMGIFWLMTSSLLVFLYNDFCDEVEDRGGECTDTDEKFIATPVLGFFCMIGWVRNLYNIDS